VSVPADSGAFTLARLALEPLAERFIVDDPGQGLLAVVPVVGGVFVHPLTREPIQALQVYAAGPDRVKILEPRILRSLPVIPILGMRHPSQLCAEVARLLGGALQELGQIRDAVAGLGIVLDLERDVLRLRGRVRFQELDVELCTRYPGQLTITGLGWQSLFGLFPIEARSIKLSGQATADLDDLVRLVFQLSGASASPPPVPAAPAAPAVPAEPAQPAPPAPGASEAVVELVETVAPAPPPAAAPQAVPLEDATGALRLQWLVDRLGKEAEISAHAGRLRLVVPLKVVQGQYTFYLEQRQRSTFVGFLVSPKGARHKVEVDLANLLDIKELFDSMILGKGH
jgi:hypothetical protein